MKQFIFSCLLIIIASLVCPNVKIGQGQIIVLNPFTLMNPNEAHAAFYNLNPLGLEKLTSGNFSANAASIGPFTFAARKSLIIDFVITGYTGGDIGAFQFNADTTAANYGSEFVTATNVATPVIARSAANAGTIAMIPVSGTTQTVGRRGFIRISNIAASRKVADIRISDESATSTAPPGELYGWGEWLNTTAQITQIKMLLVGANSLTTNTGFVVYGSDY